MEQYDQHLRDTPKKIAQGATKTYKGIKKAVNAIKTALKLAKALLVAIKAIVAFFAIGGWVLVLLGLFVVIAYTIIMSPVTVSRELEQAQADGTYTGRVLSYFLDVTDEWDEELDQAAVEHYESFDDKCLDGLNEFQVMQANSYKLPYSLLMGIERINLFMSHDTDGWFPDPSDIYDELKTHYTWIDSEINYSVQISYSYEYSYAYEVTSWWSYSDCEGISDSDTSTSEISVSGNESDTVTITFDNLVKLLDIADAFDQQYIFSYEDYVTKDMVSGFGRYSESTGMQTELESEVDEHGAYFLSNPVFSDGITGENDKPLKEFIEDWTSNLRLDTRNEALTIEGYPTSHYSSGSCGEDEHGNSLGSWSYSSGSYISKHPYNIQFNFEYTIDQATKHYQPLLGVETHGEKFERLFVFLNEYLEHEADVLDIEMIFHVATEYDPEFAYNYSANDSSLFFSGFYNTQVFYDGTLGTLAWPVSDHNSRISSMFGPRGAVRSGGRIVSSAGFHGGVDIASGGRKIPVFAASDGVVIFSGISGSITSGYGRTVIIDHGVDGNGRRILTLYAHLDYIGVDNGQLVSTGEQIGIMGDTGSSSGVHLHFEIRINNQRQNPLNHYPREAYQNYL